jgi:hypothetical protein
MDSCKNCKKAKTCVRAQLVPYCRMYIPRVQADRACAECGNPQVLTHHIFGAASREYSEKYGLTIDLCQAHHEQIHTDPELRHKWQVIAQSDFEAVFGHAVFMEAFRRNYLDPELQTIANDAAFWQAVYEKIKK